MFAKLLSASVVLQVTSCDEPLLDESDSIVGQYPILIYKHWLIPRRYIWHFWCQLSQLDKDLSPDQVDVTNNLSETLLNRFGLVVVSISHPKSFVRLTFDTDLTAAHERARIKAESHESSSLACKQVNKIQKRVHGF